MLFAFSFDYSPNQQIRAAPAPPSFVNNPLLIKSEMSRPAVSCEHFVILAHLEDVSFPKISSCILLITSRQDTIPAKSGSNPHSNNIPLFPAFAGSIFSQRPVHPCTL